MALTLVTTLTRACADGLTMAQELFDSYIKQGSMNEIRHGSHSRRRHHVVNAALTVVVLRRAASRRRSAPTSPGSWTPRAA